LIASAFPHIVDAGKGLNIGMERLRAGVALDIVFDKKRNRRLWIWRFQSGN
jgi:hypothetical protein